MSKIKLTERQISMLQKLESESPKKILKINESQYKRLFKENLLIESKGSPKKDIDSLKFAQQLIVFIKDIIKNPKNIPFSSYWKDLGLTKHQLFNLVKKEGILDLTVDESTGENTYGAKKLGFRRGIKNIYKEITSEEKPMVEADGGYPFGAEDDPNAPWNERGDESNDEAEGPIRPMEVLKPIYFDDREDILLLKYEGSYYIFIAPTHNAEEFIPYEDIDDVIDAEAVSSYVNDNYVNNGKVRAQQSWEALVNGELCVVTPEIRAKLFDNYGDSVKLLEYISQIPETTGSASSGAYVGGSPFNMGSTKGLSPEEAMAELINDGNLIDDDDEVPIDETTSTTSGGGGEGAWGAGPLGDATQTAGNLVVPLNRDLKKDRETGGGAKSHPNTVVKRPMPVTESIFGNGYKEGQVYRNGMGRAKIRKIEGNNLVIRRWGDKPAFNVTIDKNQLGGWELMENVKSKLKITEAQLKRIIESDNMTSTAYPNGEMVKLDDCTKLNNNKVAQNGGCSQGDDGVVKLSKTKGSVVAENGNQIRYAAEMDFYLWANDDKSAIQKAKYLAENLRDDEDNRGRITKLVRQPFGQMGNTPVDMMGENEIVGDLVITEALNLKYNKEKNELVVISDLTDIKGASKETYASKNALKKNGFKWDGTNWVISADNLDVAKRTLTEVNKIEYFVDKLTDLEEILSSAGGGKSLISAQLDQYIMDIANATDDAAASAEIKRFLTFFANFRQYSFYNSILIYIQKPDAKKVAGYHKWAEVNRQVNKGAKAITILAPIFSKDKIPGDVITNPLTGEVKDTRAPINFRPVKVFDISDTTATSEAGEIPATPEWWGNNEPSEVADMLYHNLTVVADNLGIKHTTTDAKGGEKGYSAGDHINLTSDVQGAGRASTMAHELAHEMMHWKNKSMYYIGDEEIRDRALVEMQAESVSYVVLKHYGIPVKHHAKYLALWKANKDKILKYMRLIADVADFIIKEVDKVAKYEGNTKVTSESINEILREMENSFN